MLPSAADPFRAEVLALLRAQGEKIEAQGARIAALEARLADPVHDFLHLALHGLGGPGNDRTFTCQEYLRELPKLPNAEAVQAAMLRVIRKPDAQLLGNLFRECEGRGSIGGIVVQSFGKDHNRILWGIRVG